MVSVFSHYVDLCKATDNQNYVPQEDVFTRSLPGLSSMPVTDSKDLSIDENIGFL